MNLHLTKFNKKFFVLSCILSLCYFALALTIFISGKISGFESSLLFRILLFMTVIPIYFITIIYVYSSIQFMVIFKNVVGIVRIVHSIGLILVINYLLFTETEHSVLFVPVILIVVGLFVFLANLYFKLNQSITIDTNFDMTIESIASNNNGVILYQLYFIVILILIFGNDNVSRFGNYTFLLIFNGFLLYKYIVFTNQTRKSTITMILITIILSLISITIYQLFYTFIIYHHFIAAFMSVLPTIYLTPIIFRNYHVIMWKRMHD